MKHLKKFNESDLPDFTLKREIASEIKEMTEDILLDLKDIDPEYYYTVRCNTSAENDMEHIKNELNKPISWVSIVIKNKNKPEISDYKPVIDRLINYYASENIKPSRYFSINFDRGKDLDPVTYTLERFYILDMTFEYEWVKYLLSRPPSKEN